jgi:hypothetical protein
VRKPSLPCPPLESLDLTGADVGDPGFAQLAPLTQLERFEAVRTRLGTGVGATLSQWPQLKVLKLDYNTVTGALLEAIAKRPLAELELDSTNITDAAVNTLATMKTLQRLNLYRTLISEDARNRLPKALPQTTII